MEEKKSVVHLVFPNQYLCASTCIRFGEYYESSHFSGRLFTLEECLDWYALKHEVFDYFVFAIGFNFPVDSLKKFEEGLFDPLSVKEKKCIDLVKRFPDCRYIIATTKKEIEHELLHALFYLFPEYRRDVIEIVRIFKPKKMFRALKSLGYCKTVFPDEINAFTIEPGKCILCRRKRGLRKSLRRVFKKHFGFLPHKGMIHDDFIRGLITTVKFNPMKRSR